MSGSVVDRPMLDGSAAVAGYFANDLRRPRSTTDPSRHRMGCLLAIESSSAGLTVRLGADGASDDRPTLGNRASIG